MVHAVLAVSLRINQSVSGRALVIVVSGLSAYLGRSGATPVVESRNGVIVIKVFPTSVGDLPGIGPAGSVRAGSSLRT